MKDKYKRRVKGVIYGGIAAVALIKAYQYAIRPLGKIVKNIFKTK